MKFRDVEQSAKHNAIILRIQARVYPKVIYGKDFVQLPGFETCFRDFKCWEFGQQVKLTENYTFLSASGNHEIFSTAN